MYSKYDAIKVIVAFTHNKHNIKVKWNLCSWQRQSNKKYHKFYSWYKVDFFQ